MLLTVYSTTWYNLFMTPEELNIIITDIYKTNRALANEIGHSEVTVSRWAHGVYTIGKPEALLLRLIQALHERDIDWRSWVKK